MFIVIEGADGTGKSTLCPLLSDIIGAVSCKTPPDHYEKSRKLIDKSASPAEKYAYYKTGVIETSKYIRKLLAEGKHVVVDRYWLTTFIYHEIIGVPVRRSDFKDIIEPDLTILLSMHIDIQLQRMHQRGLSIRDRNMIDKQETISLAYYRNILKYNLPFIALNTGIIGQDDCASICAEIINSIISRSR
ncbi:MAG: deoxynucleoside kinase [Candidatus Taylorbacteria bacterium]